MKTNFKITNPLHPKTEYTGKTDVLSDGKKAASIFKPILKVVILLLFSITIYHSNAAKHDKALTSASSLKTGGSIVVIDDYLVDVSTSDASNIEDIQVYSGSTLVYSAKGCYSTSCQYDLSSLSAGTYLVDVHTSTGLFSGYVSIK